MCHRSRSLGGSAACGSPPDKTIFREAQQVVRDVEQEDWMETGDFWKERLRG